MIDLHYWPTPNGHKITLFLEETGLPYRIVPVDIGRGEQFQPDFLTIAPNNRMPAIVDHEPAGGGAPISVFESGAILLYLAEKTGSFIPADLRGRVEVLQWLFWQMGGLGPMAGQNHHFAHLRAGEDPLRDRSLRQRDQPALRRARQAARRPAVRGRRVFDRRHGVLSVDRAARAPGQNLADFPHLERWFDADRGAAGRPSVPTRSVTVFAVATPRWTRRPSRSCSARPRPHSAQGVVGFGPQTRFILASTRPGRVGATIARWIHGVAVEHGTFDAELVDLAELDLPLYNEPRHPVLQQYEPGAPDAGVPGWPPPMPSCS